MMIDPRMKLMAFETRDNAIHEWRDLDEIAADEGVPVVELELACEAVLTTADLVDILQYRIKCHRSRVKSAC